MAKQKRYSMAFRERAVRRMKLGDNVSKLARELGVQASRGDSSQPSAPQLHSAKGSGRKSEAG
jgi:transposase-like protein